MLKFHNARINRRDCARYLRQSINTILHRRSQLRCNRGLAFIRQPMPCTCDRDMVRSSSLEVLEGQATAFGHDLLEQCFIQVAYGHRV